MPDSKGRITKGEKRGFIYREFSTANHIFADSLIRETFERIKEQKKSLPYVSSISGIPTETFSKWKKGSVPNISNLRAVLQSIGYDLQIVKKD